jgi:hypothetical protein
MYNSGGTVNSTLDYTLWTLYRSYYKSISTNVEQCIVCKRIEVYSEMCC